jgi:hypothetical protein
VFLVEGRREIKLIDPGGVQTVRLNFKLPKPLKRENLDFKVTIFDGGSNIYLTDRIHLPVGVNLPTQKQDGFWQGSVVEKNVAVFTSPTLNSPKLADVPGGSTLLADKKHGSWFRVRMAQDTSGWILGRDLTKIQELTGKARRKAGPQIPVAILTEKNPPIIEQKFGGISEQIMNGNFQLNFAISDAEGLKDIYVYQEDDKISYIQLPRNNQTYELKINIPLKSGSNDITVVARDASNLLSSFGMSVNH